MNFSKLLAGLGALWSLLLERSVALFALVRPVEPSRRPPGRLFQDRLVTVDYFSVEIGKSGRNILRPESLTVPLEEGERRSVIQAAIWARERSPSLRKILATWLLAVFVESESSWAIWRLVSPQDEERDFSLAGVSLRSFFGRWPLLRHHQRLFHQPGHQVKHIVFVDAAPGPHRLRGLEREASREHREPPEQLPLRLVKQLVAPVQRRPQGPMARNGAPSARGQQLEGMVEP